MPYFVPCKMVAGALRRVIFRVIFGAVSCDFLQKICHTRSLNCIFAKRKTAYLRDFSANTRLSFWRRKRDLNPRDPFEPYSLSRGAPSPLGYFSSNGECDIRGICWRRGWDSNPRCIAASPVFKTGSLNRSDTSPFGFSFIIIA